MTHRDRNLLTLLYRLRVLTAEQLTQLGFSNVKTCQRRLRKLKAIGVVDDAQLPTTHTGRPLNIYFLTTDGGRLLGLENRRSAPTSLLFLDHQLRVNWLLVRLLMDTSTRGYAMTFLTEGEYRGLPDVSRVVIPDAVVELRNRAGETALFYVEVDNGTERLTSLRAPHKAVQAKMAAYAALLAGGRGTVSDAERVSRGFRVLFVVSEATRLERLRCLAALSPQPSIFWFATIADVQHHDVLGALWRVAGINETRALVRAKETIA